MCLIWPYVAMADSGFMQSRGALFEMEPVASQQSSASLFAGATGRSLFAPIRSGVTPLLGTWRGDPRVRQLFDLISRAESGRDGYDAVQHGARQRPSKRPTDMSIAEIYAWIAATPGQPHAIGRYQFIPATLKRLVARSGTPVTAQFGPAVQDRLADLLLREAGYEAFLDGEIDKVGFMNNLARIWAGLPNASGQSHYHGVAGNRASISWARFHAEMAQIFPTL
ncbi:hypothetical protein ACJ5NV_14080 [Loktanella agnita]|uniref:hypothetical protein n=1 Tax=Loktanella agnita TaxID=287097 RepID=UPI003985C1E0